MSEDRDRRVKELFERVLDAPPSEREEILERESRGQSIQGDVRELLGTEPGLAGFLETPASERVFGPACPEPPLAAGDVVADFTVVAPVGEGGGGVVYEAEQRDPRRRVALKVLKTSRRRGDALRRLREEAQNLARLQHPAIGHVYAAGVREHGGAAQPWIAMELIRDARSIVRYARETVASRDEKLRLLATVCEALHHAHENGVVHRDVTPGNVLVGRDGRPKVVDFGVAQGASGDLLGDAVGTLPYASPEQLDGSVADRRADVYGLGALAYELLTGAVPLDVGDLSVSQAAEAKRTRSVPPPSSRAPGIPRDLDAIVLRALARVPAARYESAAALGADVARFLGGEPVAAYGGGSTYHLAKFVRRNRAIAAAVAGISAALLAGTAVSLWFAVENASARGLAERRSYFAEVAAAAAALRVDDVAEARRRLERAPERLRDWEWRHLASRLDGSRSTLRFPDRQFRYGSISGDGRLLAFSGLDRRVRPVAHVVALARSDGEILREWSSFGGNVPACALSADGRRLAAGFEDGRVVLFDASAGAELPAPTPHASRVISVAFSADGRLFATTCSDGTARVCVADDGTVAATLDGHGDWVICAAFDPGAERLATGCKDGSVHVWDIASARRVLRLPGHEGSVDGVAVSPDGTRLASVGRDRTVRLWNLADGASVAVGRSHTSNVRDVAFDPEGRSFVSASWDGTIRVWDARTGAETGILRGHESLVTKVAFAAAEPRLASFSEDGTVRRWDVGRTDLASFRGLEDNAAALAFDPSGDRVAVAGNDGTLTILDARTARPLGRAKVGSDAVRYAAFAGPASLVVATVAPGFEVWDLGARDGAPSRARRVAPVEKGNPMALVALDRGGRAAWTWERPTANRHSSLECVDIATGAVLASRPTPFAPSCLACDGRGGLAIASEEGEFAASGPDGAWATARTARGAVVSLAFDEAGERIVAAVSRSEAVVLRARDLAALRVLRGHSGEVHQAAFLPGGRRIVTVSRDRTVRLWDAEDGENVLVLHEQGYMVHCVAVSPDGTRIATGAGATGDRQSSVTIWAAPER